jgi:hypothetical protein
LYRSEEQGSGKALGQSSDSTRVLPMEKSKKENQSGEHIPSLSTTISSQNYTEKIYIQNYTKLPVNQL